MARNPYEHDDPDGQDLEDEDVKFCRGCQGIIPAPAEGQFWNGWTWCLDCYHELQPVVEDLARSHRVDEDRDDFNQVRR